MIHIFLATILCTLSTESTRGHSQKIVHDDRMNIVVILADDLGIGDVGAYNPDSMIPTPHLDALADEGVRFSDAHSPSSVCTPTRYGILTGRYAWRTDLKRWVLDGSSPLLLESDRPNIANVLAGAGYHTSGIGKWHLGLGSEQPTDYEKPFDSGPLSIGFDHFEGIPASLDMEPYVWIIDDRPENPVNRTMPGSRHRRQGGGGFWRAGRTTEGFDIGDVLPRIGRTACQVIKERARKDQPFFLYIPLSAPHTPWLPDQEHTGRSRAGHYGDFVAMVDTVVGDVIDCISESGIDDRTMIVFTSDNGAHWPEADIVRHGHAANLGWRGQKADIHEGGHRVPFIIQWPGTVEPGGVSDETICLTDVFPTVLDGAGIELPSGAAPDGISLMPLLDPDRGPISKRVALIHHSGDGMFAIRCGRWKMIESLGSGGFTRPARVDPPEEGPSCQLYDLESDPSETMNLASDHPEKVVELRALLNSIRNTDADGVRSGVPGEGSEN